MLLWASHMTSVQFGTYSITPPGLSTMNHRIPDPPQPTCSWLWKYIHKTTHVGWLKYWILVMSLLCSHLNKCLVLAAMGRAFCYLIKEKCIFYKSKWWKICTGFGNLALYQWVDYIQCITHTLDTCIREYNHAVYYAPTQWTSLSAWQRWTSNEFCFEFPQISLWPVQKKAKVSGIKTKNRGGFFFHWDAKRHNTEMPSHSDPALSVW